MVDLKDITKGYGAIKISKEKLLKLIPEDEQALLPEREEDLFVKINLKDLEEMGLNFDTFKIICMIYKKNNDYYLKICYN